MIPIGPDVPGRTGTPATVRLRRLPDRIAADRAIDAAEAFRDLPGLAILESARPGRNARWTYLTADPVAVLESPAAGPDPFAVARRLLARLDATPIVPADAPRFLGGLVGYLGYDLGHALERLPSLVEDDQGLPPLRLALHDWVVAWDRRTGHAWIGGRALDGDQRRLARRLDDVHARLLAPRPTTSDADGEPGIDEAGPLVFRSSVERADYERRVELVRGHIARGDIYQANLTRRLATPFDADPWPRYRRLRTGDPSLFSAYLDLGPSPETGRPRALLSASPEPFLSVDQDGVVASDPIKGTRPRGRDRTEDRALACELLASAKDRAENVMIVDVLRNDLGRVCVPGSVRVPRLCRLERTAAVQHLVSTVTGQLADGRDAFDLLAASFPGGSITGAPKIRAMELLEGLELVRRGPYTGALGWIGPEGAMQTSILIRTLVADGRRLTLHVGGGITWGSEPAAEWDETVAKARGPLGAIGGLQIGLVSKGSLSALPGHVWVDGRILPADAAHLSVFDRGFQLGDGVFETLRARGGRPTELAEHLARLHRSADGLDLPLPDDVDARLAGGIAELLAAEDLDGADGDASVRITVSRGPYRSRGVLPPDEDVPATLVIQVWPVAAAPAGHLEDGLHLVASRVRRDPQDPLAALKTTSRAEYVYARLEARRAGADDALFLTIDDHLSEGTSANVFLVRTGADGAVELATPSLDCAILAGTTRSWLLGWAASVGLRPVETQLGREDLAGADEAFLCSSVAGVLPVTRFEDAPIGAGRPGPWTRRARAEREAMIRGEAGG